MPRRPPAARSSFALACAWLACASATAPPAHASDRDAARSADLVAVRVTPENAARTLVGGPDAIGGIGDWALGNGTLCAIVSDPSHEGALSPRGGVLVDLGHCGRDDDQFNFLHPLFNLSRGLVPAVAEIRAEIVDGQARVVTSGAYEGVLFETVYSLEAEPATVLRIETRLERIAPGSTVFLFGDVVFHGNASLRSFTTSVRGAGASPGFIHPPVEVESPWAMIGAIVDADTQVLVGSPELEPGISYALTLVSARNGVAVAEGAPAASPLPHFAVNGPDFSLLAIAPRPWWFGGDDGPGLLELPQLAFMDVAAGRPVVYERAIHVGARADVASALDGLRPNAVRVRGRLDRPDAVVHVDDPGGSPVTMARPGADGGFDLRLDPGAYVLRARAPGGRQVERTIAVDGDAHDAGLLAVGSPARVRLPRGRPMRLTFRGEAGTPDPVIDPDLDDLRFGAFAPPSAGRAGHVSLSGGPGDPAWLVLPPGRYAVWASRGPEFGLTRATLDLPEASTRELEIASPARALATPGWIAADLHVHSVASDDSALPIDRRVASFVAEGVEAVVSTEHDRVFDYAPRVRALGLEGRVASVVGVEVTSSAVTDAVPYTAGHANAFPVPHRHRAYAGGALAGEGRRLRDVVAQLRGLGGERLLQLNHPRPGAGPANLNELFTHLSVTGEPFDPASALDSPVNGSLVEPDPEHGLRDLDFDAMELLNGVDQERYWRTRADWMALLLQGAVRTGTANSDSHRAGEVLGLPRSYVRAARDDPAAFDEAAFVRAIREGRVVGTTGPWLEVRLGEAEVGDLHAGATGVLVADVDAAPWVPVSRLTVYVDAVPVVTRPVTAGERVELPLAFERDAFVTVEVQGDAVGDYTVVAPGAVPFAFTNPIFVDADGDGRWRAPGLPSPVPATLRAPGPP